MSIDLAPEQQNAMEQAIQTGMVRSVDEFIGSALGTISRDEPVFDQEEARLAGARIRELRKGVRRDRQGLSLRELAHVGHKR